MIQYHYQTEFRIKDETEYTEWINNVVASRNTQVDELNFIFDTDDAVLEINKKYLNHNLFTDIITFPYRELKDIRGDIFISIDRVKENAITHKVAFDEEMRRVMIHGVLHLLGYNDKTEKESANMRANEDLALRMFHVEQ